MAKLEGDQQGVHQVVEESQHGECDEMLIIRIPYTIVKPTAMMVETVSTPITRSTVL
jgi:hypothetical protein